MQIPPTSPASPPHIVKLGTIDLDMVETTPVVFRGRLYRYEWVRTNYRDNHTGKPYSRMIDVESGEQTAPFAAGYLFGSAYVQGDTVYVTATSAEQGWTGHQVQVFASKDLKSWNTWTALDLPGWGICNTSLWRGRDRFVLMFEIHKPVEQAGVPFTARFATSKDLRHWDVTPPECVYAKDRYTAPHCLRYLDGWYYDFYLEAYHGYETRVVRSRDLIHWEASPLNPVLRASDDDRTIANPSLTTEQRERIATADDINNSDIDFCEYRGKLVIDYSWGNQTGVEQLAAAEFDGTLRQFLQAWFPRGHRR